MEKRPFNELGLSEDILKAVGKMGFEEASPIQTAVIPTIMQGRDVVGQSSTGSGKTVAFAIPAIEAVDPKVRAVQVLILCPTRELAVQVAEETGKIAFFKKGVMGVPIYGGQSYERQFRALAAGAQVVIGTPGRVMDHMERGTLKLDKLKLVILDETDRMLDMGFRDDIEHILKAVPATRQLLFFSATIPRAIQDLINRYSQDPAWIKIESVAKNAPAVEQVYFEVDRRSKIEALTRLIDVHDFRYGIIFCSTKIMVDDLDEHLHSRGYQTDRLHGDISQAQRDRVMDKFRRRGFEFLVATDVAARGLDVDDLEVVFNFDLPNDAEDYTHRIGRTGRAGKTGRAFTFVSGQEIYKLQSMVRWAKLNIKRGTIPSLDEVEEARTNVFYEKIRSTLDAKQFKPHDRMIDRLLDQGYASTDICSALIHLLQSSAGGPVAAAPAKAPAPGWTKPTKAFKPAPAWAEQAMAPKRDETGRGEAASDSAPRKVKYDRPARTGREPGMATVFLNVGRKQLVTPADVVGKIAGVTRLPAEVVGAIDIHQRHLLVDVKAEHAPLILKKLAGIKLKGEALAPAVATEADRAAE
ncbi:MAG TPA: DEAD/DEAH box helicase [Opitutaceae bacterium]|nr:DEAD/DEAH box helicase [Opitutaceae bacterium]HRJ46651.1 DEAD/DEAH box helicase [Opitutaceae bacterium]